MIEKAKMGSDLVVVTTIEISTNTKYVCMFPIPRSSQTWSMSVVLCGQWDDEWADDGIHCLWQAAEADQSPSHSTLHPTAQRPPSHIKLSHLHNDLGGGEITSHN